MFEEANKAVVLRWLDGITQRNLDVLDEVIAPTFQLGPDIPPGAQGMKQITADFLTVFPDYEVRVDQMIAEGDVVATRLTYRGTHQGTFMGIPATGKHVTWTGISVDRFRDGKLTEHHAEWNLLGLLQQLGVTITPAPSDDS